MIEEDSDRFMYTVREGDSLWNLAGRFFNNYIRWNQIWWDNPHIKNPNLIYPGDVLVIKFD